MNYKCMECQKEEFWTEADTMSHGEYRTFPAFSDCPYCEIQLCEDCYDDHKC